MIDCILSTISYAWYMNLNDEIKGKRCLEIEAIDKEGEKKKRGGGRGVEKTRTKGVD